MPAKPGEVKAKVLVCHGADDPHVPPPEVAGVRGRDAQGRGRLAIERLRRRGPQLHEPAANEPGPGRPRYNAEADRRSWQAMKDFFAEVFGK